MGTARGVGQILVQVKDVDRAVTFYRDALGLPVWMHLSEQRMAFLDAGGVRLYLDGNPSDESFSSLVYYTVDSVEDAYEQLQQQGATAWIEPHVVHRTETSELRVALLRDPEGNGFAVMADVPL